MPRVDEVVAGLSHFVVFGYVSDVGRIWLLRFHSCDHLGLVHCHARDRYRYVEGDQLCSMGIRGVICGFPVFAMI